MNNVILIRNNVTLTGLCRGWREGVPLEARNTETLAKLNLLSISGDRLISTLETRFFLLTILHSII